MKFHYSLSASLGHQVTNVRAGSLRAIRYILKSIDDLQTFNDMQLTHLLCRSLDVLVEYEEERVQALKLVRILDVFEKELPTTIRNSFSSNFRFEKCWPYRRN